MYLTDTQLYLIPTEKKNQKVRVVILNTESSKTKH
jgi:hypothetical protein